MSVFTRRVRSRRLSRLIRRGLMRAASPTMMNSVSGRVVGASSASRTMTSGPWSPPIASSAIVADRAILYPLATRTKIFREAYFRELAELAALGTHGMSATSRLLDPLCITTLDDALRACVVPSTLACSSAKLLRKPCLEQTRPSSTWQGPIGHPPSLRGQIVRHRAHDLLHRWS